MKKFLKNLSKVFKKKDFVVVHFDHELENLSPICGVQAQLKQALSNGDAGEFNCHEMLRKNGGTGEGFLYFDANDGKKLFNIIKPIVKKAGFIKNPKAKIINGREISSFDM